MAVLEIIEVDPGVLQIGVNVRTDTRADARDFARSVRERGVLEPITAYRDTDADTLVVLRGQRRALVAAQVGTPSGTVPVVVVERPDDAARITDQLVENLHRADMRDTEVCAAVEQLSLVGVSAAQISRRAALPRREVDAALQVSRDPQAKERVEQGMSLADAAIYAEFAHDPDALARLDREHRWGGQSLTHTAQRLRDEATERAELLAEVERLRADLPVPVLDPADVPTSAWALRLTHLVDEHGEHVPPEAWADVPGAAVYLTREWAHDEHEVGADEVDTDDTDDAEAPGRVFVAHWLCLDPPAAGLRDPWHRPNGSSGHAGTPTEAEQDEAREQRRRVLANNAAWRSAETVRREWLAQFLTRKTPPKTAETLIAEAVLTGPPDFAKAVGQDRHARLRALLGLDTSGLHRDQLAGLLAKATTPKAATMLTLAAVIAAWEDASGVHTWRNPTPWDQRVLAALVEWGYDPAPIEVATIDGTSPTTTVS